MGACFGEILAEVSWRWATTQGTIFGVKFFLATRLSSECCESLLGFLAYLEPKLSLKNQQLGKP